MRSDGFEADPRPVGIDAATAALSAGQAELLDPLLRRLADLRPMRWQTLGSFARGGLDRVDVEAVIAALHRAGWVEIRRRRDRAGNHQPAGLRLAEAALDEASALLADLGQPGRQDLLERLVAGLREQRERGGAPVPERVLVRRLLGQTKGVRLRDHRQHLEAAVGVRLEELVRFHVDAVLTAGPVRYLFRGVPVDLRGSAPWAAVTEPVTEAVEALDCTATEGIVCVENQTAFEALLYEGLAETAVVVFTAGYLGRVQRNWLAALVRAGVRRVRHWGDLDPWGLDIYRDLRDWMAALDPGVRVEPWRMGPEPLERPDAVRLTTEDHLKLHQYLALEGAPLRATAETMQRLGRKLEQEALLG